MLSDRARAMGTAVPHDHLANAIRVLAADSIDAAQSGHPGLPLGMADVATVLYREILRHDPSDPQWPDRDRVVLSAGHGSTLLYSALWLAGYAGVELDHLRTFRQLDSPAAGHPEVGHMPGVETTTGPLGQGLANGVGMALAERKLRHEFGHSLVDHATYVIAGDGCLMEGISHEAIALAGQQKLDRLVVLFDDNQISIDGAVSLAERGDQLARFAAFGWHTLAIDGHDPDQISVALGKARTADRPTLIACRTTIGRGAPSVEGTSAAHGAPLGSDDLVGLKAALGWDSAPFVVPEHVLDGWRNAGAIASLERSTWDSAVEALMPEQRETFLNRMTGGAPPEAVRLACRQVREVLTAYEEPLATRKASQKVLAQLALMPELIGGSADLSESTGTLTTNHAVMDSRNPGGNYIHFGVREHAMGAALNGIALHGGHSAFGSTFLVFSDYCRPAIRLSALMGLPVVYVMTHDSFWLGEDGPTHQPVEHIESLRAIPNLLVLRPADAVETADAWEVALTQNDRPSVICLTRQSLPALPTRPDPSRVAGGAYFVRRPAKRHVTLICTGSEVSLALQSAEGLAERDIQAAVLSVPCVELMAELGDEHVDELLGPAPRIVVEAGIAGSWSRWLRPGDRFIGMTGFGASGPAPQLAERFGFTVPALIRAVEELIGEDNRGGN